MPLSSTGELVAAAAARRGAVAAFNVITLEHIEAVISASEALDEPVVLQLSENAVKFRAGRLDSISVAAVAAARAATVPVALHLDHVKSGELLRKAADCGFGSVMFDAAHLPYGRTSPRPAGPRSGPTPTASGWRPNSARSAARTVPARWTPTPPAPGPTPTRPGATSRRPGWTRSPWPSAARTR